MRSWIAVLSLALIGMSPLGAEPALNARRAITIEMPDKTELAADIIVPTIAKRFPTVLVMTPYGRGTRLRQGAIDAFTASGFALVFVDMRGTGASQGHVDLIFSPQERADIGAILNWIGHQPWSNGRVVATGVSYDANLAALTLASGSSIVAGVVPRFIDFDTYRDLAVPGGVRNEMLFREWGALTTQLNSGGTCLFDASQCVHADNLLPLDGDADFAILRHALLDHQQDWNPTIDTAGYAFEDDVVPSGLPLRAGFLSSHGEALKTSRVPVQIWGSWFDASTADSALDWFLGAPDAPVTLYLGAWPHGGGQRADPFVATTAEDEAGAPVPAQVFLDFANRVVRGEIPARAIHYYTSGAQIWRTTPAWPPAGIGKTRWYLGAQHGLTRKSDSGRDRYQVDFTASTGTTNRWTTQMGGGPVAYGDRKAQDEHLLTFTSTPLGRAIEITGAPVVTLHLVSSCPDGAVFAYLEAVSPDGKVTYVS
ncbi:MAG TPA: CocE/NonD family hydrolase, partial [Rhizomicrobium sp.]